jgi:hypothetical protein
MLLALAASVLVAFAVPAIASASNWTKNGHELKVTELQWTQDGVPLTGETTASFEGTFGSSNHGDCAVSGEMSLRPSRAVGALTKFTLSSCQAGPIFKSLGCSLSSATANGLPWAYAAKSVKATSPQELKIMNVSVTYTFSGGLCGAGAKDTVSGAITATPDNSSKVSSLSLWGELNDPAFGGEGGATEISGSLGLAPAEKYGLMGTNVVDLQGSMSFSGGFECSMNAKMVLEPGSSGRVYSWQANECTVTGAFSARGCVAASFTATDLPWTVHDEGSFVKFSDFGFTGKLTGVGSCAGGVPLTLEGDVAATPFSKAAISSTTLSGEMSGNLEAAMEGTFNWSPSGVYGL